MENYTKYNRNVIPGIEESLSKIAAKVTENALVLDVGCSSGMMGRYLALEKGCIVDGIDIDEKALENCKPVYRKIAIKNLEIDDLTDVLVKESYDFIIVADVIEHLNDPGRLLAQLKLLVKPHGTIIFSVPNITHIAASLELLLGNFDYRQNGLLDSTHIRFYSYTNLIAKFNNSGLYAWEVDVVHKDLGETEFGTEQDRLFPRKWLDTLIAVRPDSLVYQWIVTTKIYPRLDQAEPHPATKKITATPIFATALYWENSAGAGFNETQKIVGFKTSKIENEFTIDFNFQLSPEEKISQIRIDPVSEKKPVWIKSVKISDTQNGVLWEWSGKEGTSDLISAKWVDTQLANGRILCAESDDPQWYPEIPVETLHKITAGAKFSIVMCDDNSVIGSVLVDALSTQKMAANQAAAERDRQIANLNQDVAERDGQIASLNQAVAERDRQIAALNQAVAERDRQIASLNQAVAEQKEQIASYVAERDHIMNSTSWKITKPLRFIRESAINKPNRLMRKTLSDGMRLLWHKMPFSTRQKLLFKHRLFSNLPAFFSWGKAYRSWAAMNAPCDEASDLTTHQVITLHPSEQTTDTYVPLLQVLPPKNIPIRLIAFYLPQFHAIAENNSWWGEGFTEWTNVKPAQPQFEGHYQPHLPGELGYYSLLDSTIQRRQIELAMLYGVGGFCFYTYWFGGKLLLEKPVENYLSDRSLDFPFCLCWANENWSRRWDGLDSEILIGQQHSPEDDLAFIQHVAQYLKDERYIRIDGKPLLLVYRPSLLPSVKETAQRWREWCLNNEIGEIYLAYTQSFETADPKNYGFDAAIEFPPNNSSPPNITETVKPLTNRFGGTVYDWKVFVERSRNYQKPEYKLFRSVCPSWDNTARRKNKGTVFLNSTPQDYQEWLKNAVIETCTRIVNPEERLVFVNAWNEWAEGAYLEPDQRHGYAYLEATRLAMIRSSLVFRERSDRISQVIAIILHVFYEDVLGEILQSLSNIIVLPVKLYVTTTAEKEERVRALLESQTHDYLLLVVKNRGRDILPFMKILPVVIRAGHNFLVKIHTKKSLHRADGNEWRKDLFGKLLDNAAMANAINLFNENPHIGILGPEGHLVAMSYFWGSNAERVTHLASRMGVDPSILTSLNFVAGSMFIARLDAMVPLLNLAINDSDFEPEMGQTDGTLAHAIERLFSVSAHSIELSTTCPSNAALTEYKFVQHRRIDSLPALQK